MQDIWFWRVMACAALLAAAGYVVSRFTEAPAVQAQGGDIVAVTGWDETTHRLYLVDQARKVVLVYGYGSGNQKFDFTLIAARYYDIDAQATVGSEYPGSPKGYDIRYMYNELKKKAPAAAPK